MVASVGRPKQPGQGRAQQQGRSSHRVAAVLHTLLLLGGFGSLPVVCEACAAWTPETLKRRCSARSNGRSLARAVEPAHLRALFGSYESNAFDRSKIFPASLWIISRACGAQRAAVAACAPTPQAAAWPACSLPGWLGRSPPSWRARPMSPPRERGFPPTSSCWRAARTLVHWSSPKAPKPCF